MAGLFGYVSGLFKRQVHESSNSPARAHDDEDDDAEESIAQRKHREGEERPRLFEYPGRLYLLKGNVYMHLCEPGQAILTLEQSPSGDLEYVMNVLDTESGSYHLSQDVADGLQIQYSYRNAAIYWYAMVGEDLQSFCFRMDKGDAAVKFIEIYNQCVYSAMIGEPIPDSFFNDEDFNYMASAFTNGVPADVEGDDDNDADEQPQQQSPPRVDDDTSDDAVFEYDDANASRTATGAGVNLCFADSMQFNRTIVVKEGKKGECLIQAHAYNERGYEQDGSQQFSVTGLGSKPPAIVGQQAMLADGDTKMLMLNKNDSSRVIEVDLGAGKVVQEYQPGLDYQVHSATAQHKNGNQNPNLVSCLGTSAAFSIDTRLDPTKCAVVEDGKNLTDYTHTLRGTQKFTCHATSEQGHLAIGDLCGQIRLFSGPPGSKKLVGKGHFPKTAKTLLKGSPNTPITGLDITADGAYILATCDKFLLVLCTQYMEKEDKLSNGFTARMGKDKPKPLRLELNPFQKQQLGGADKVKFTKATFQSNAATGEHWIAAACGPLLVTWNFPSVRRALDNHTSTSCELKNERSILRSVDMKGPRETITFMTDDEVGMEVKAANSTRRSGKVYHRFQ